MKRYGNLWPRICDRENIELAADNALKGKKQTAARRHFIENRKELLDELEQSLINETYHFSFLKFFEVYEPKKRLIHHSPFYPDKVLHHCVMNVVVPYFLEKMTADTYGSIKGRGVMMAAERISKALHKHPDWYFVQIDCRKFYQSIDHDVCKAAVRRVIKCPKTLRMIDSIIDVHEEGLAIGVYPSQYLANLVLSSVDHWAKEVMRIPYYFRYMDDILMIVPDKATAHIALNQITEKLKEVKLEVKENARIAPVRIGIDIIGYKFYPTHTLLRKRIKEHMQKIVRELNKQGATDEYFKLKTASHFGWCKHANCYHLMETTFGERFNLYKNNMEFKRLSEIRGTEQWFGLPRESRVSITELFDKEIIFFEFMVVTIKEEEKVVVKFAYPDKPEEYHCFITRSDVMKDRLNRDQEIMPFIATVKHVKKYTAYE